MIKRGPVAGVVHAGKADRAKLSSNRSLEGDEGAAGPTAPVEYPCSAGLAMADNDVQAATMHYADNALREHFRATGRLACVATDTFVYFENGEPRSRVDPEVLVVMGVSGRMRNSYRVWEEGGKAPDFVLEVISINTLLRDEGPKREMYRQIGVREAFRYDPRGDTMAPRTGRRLIGRRRSGGNGWS